MQYRDFKEDSSQNLSGNGQRALGAAQIPKEGDEKDVGTRQVSFL